MFATYWHKDVDKNFRYSYLYDNILPVGAIVERGSRQYVVSKVVVYLDSDSADVFMEEQ